MIDCPSPMADEPVAHNGYADPEAVPHSTPPACKEHRGNRQLLCHPCRFEEAVEAITPRCAEVEGGRMIEVQPTVYLPSCIDQHGVPIGEIIMAIRLPLRPAAQVMGGDHPERTARARARPDPDQKTLPPERTVNLR